MLEAIAVSTFMVLLTVVIHYEGLQLISNFQLRIALVGRPAIIGSITCLFALHTVEIWLYALAYLLMEQFDSGQIKGAFAGTLHDYLYFSATSYTSLGLGDVYPQGSARLVAGIEALNGLVLIGWSASYSYLVMERLWGFPGERRSHRRVDVGDRENSN